MFSDNECVICLTGTCFYFKLRDRTPLSNLQSCRNKMNTQKTIRENISRGTLSFEFGTEGDAQQVTITHAQEGNGASWFIEMITKTEATDSKSDDDEDDDSDDEECKTWQMLQVKDGFHTITWGYEAFCDELVFTKHSMTKLVNQLSGISVNDRRVHVTCEDHTMTFLSAFENEKPVFWNMFIGEEEPSGPPMSYKNLAQLIREEKRECVIS